MPSSSTSSHSWEVPPHLASLPRVPVDEAASDRGKTGCVSPNPSTIGSKSPSRSGKPDVRWIVLKQQQEELNQLADQYGELLDSIKVREGRLPSTRGGTPNGSFQASSSGFNSALKVSPTQQCIGTNGDLEPTPETEADPEQQLQQLRVFSREPQPAPPQAQTDSHRVFSKEPQPAPPHAITPRTPSALPFGAKLVQEVEPSAEEIYRIQNPPEELHRLKDAPPFSVQGMHLGMESFKGMETIPEGSNVNEPMEMPLWQTMAMQHYLASMAPPPAPMVNVDSDTDGAFPMGGLWPQLPFYLSEPPMNPYATGASGAQESNGEPNGLLNGHHYGGANGILNGLPNGLPNGYENGHLNGYHNGVLNGYHDDDVSRSLEIDFDDAESDSSVSDDDFPMHYTDPYLFMPNANLFFFMHAQHVMERQAQEQEREAQQQEENVGKQVLQQWLWAQKVPAQRRLVNPLGPPSLEQELGRKHSFSDQGSGSHKISFGASPKGSRAGSRSGTPMTGGSGTGTPKSKSHSHGKSSASQTSLTSGHGTPQHHLKRGYSMAISNSLEYHLTGAQGKKLALGRKDIITLRGRECAVSLRGPQQKRFFQQEFKDSMWPAWFYTPLRLGICSQVLGLMMIGIGALIVWSNSSLSEVRLEYTSKDESVRFELAEDMEGPIYFYYELSGFYVNYRTFVESKDDYVFSSTFAKYNCDGSAVSDDVAKVRPSDAHFADLVNAAVSKNSGEMELQPCGMVAMTFFMDEYNLTYESADNAVIPLDQSDLSWLSDDVVLDSKMVSSGPNVTIKEMSSWLTPELLEHFKVWYRTSASSNFRQLWARIPDGLRAGKYAINIPINSAIWDETWNVGKAIVLAQVGLFGCKNLVLGYLYIACGLLMMMSSALVYFGPPSGLLRWYYHLTEPVAPPLAPEPILEGHDQDSHGSSDHSSSSRRGRGVGDILDKQRTSRSASDGGFANADNLPQATVKRNTTGEGFTIRGGPPA